MTTTISHTTLHQFRRDAEKFRNAWLLGINEGVFTVDDLLDAARIDKPLARIKVRKMLAAQPEWNTRKVNHFMRRFTLITKRLLGTDVPHDPPVSWVIHAQAPNRREVFNEALYWPDTQAPWPGFPYTRRPR